jgi:hypothetical protein
LASGCEITAEAPLSCYAGPDREQEFLMRTLRLIAMLLAIGAAGRAYADDAPATEALQAANQLLSILSPDMVHQMASQTTNVVWPPIAQKLRAQNVDEATLAELRKEFEDIQVQNFAEIMKAAPPVYARHFTADELHQLIAFYQTPIGIKSLRELPQVMGEFFATIAPRLQAVQQETVARFNDILRQHGYLK